LSEHGLVDINKYLSDKVGFEHFAPAASRQQQQCQLWHWQPASRTSWKFARSPPRRELLESSKFAAPPSKSPPPVTKMSRFFVQSKYYIIAQISASAVMLPFFFPRVASSL
jgi:hypothetical protein